MLMVLIYPGFTFGVYIMVYLYHLDNLGYIEVPSTSANERFKAVAHYPVFAILGYCWKKNSVGQETIA